MIWLYLIIAAEGLLIMKKMIRSYIKSYLKEVHDELERSDENDRE